jgi:hypothetical protein
VYSAFCAAAAAAAVAAAAVVCSAMSLTPLVLLRNLRRLELSLPGLLMTVADARRLVSSMQCIPSVTMTVMPVVQPVVLAALDSARASHMAVPREVEIQVNNSWSLPGVVAQQMPPLPGIVGEPGVIMLVPGVNIVPAWQG